MAPGFNNDANRNLSIHRAHKPEPCLARRQNNIGQSCIANASILKRMKRQERMQKPLPACRLVEDDVRKYMQLRRCVSLESWTSCQTHRTKPAPRYRSAATSPSADHPSQQTGLSWGATRSPSINCSSVRSH
jgi:hypothetical protein